MQHSNKDISRTKISFALVDALFVSSFFSFFILFANSLFWLRVFIIFMIIFTYSDTGKYLMINSAVHASQCPVDKRKKVPATEKLIFQDVSTLSLPEIYFSRVNYATQTCVALLTYKRNSEKKRVQLISIFEMIYVSNSIYFNKILYSRW